MVEDGSKGPPASVPAGTRVGQYLVEQRIGSGGMAEVYEARHTGLDKRVALKILRRELAVKQSVVERFLREGQLASRIRHPNVVDVTDVGVIDELPCLVMEYIEGETLRTLFKRETRLPVSRIVDLMLPVIAAVDAAHAQGVVHRDLKPANILITRGVVGELVPKVLDFGISKFLAEPTPSALTTDSTFLGSPHYVAPEIARGERVLDGRCDQYSIGVILYEGLCGVRPFQHRSDTFMSLMYAIAAGDFEPPSHHAPDLPEELERIILRAMTLAPAARYTGLSDLGRALLPFASERIRAVWAPAFDHEPVLPDMTRTVVEVPQANLEDTQGTMGSGAQEVAARKERGGSRLAWLAVAALVVIVVAPLTWKLTRSAPSPAAHQPTSSPEPALAEPTSYIVRVEANPPEALIQLDGRRVGEGKFVRTLPMDGTTHTLRVSAPGFEDVVLAFTDAPPPGSIELVPATPSDVAAEPPEPEPEAEPAPAPAPRARAPEPRPAAPAKPAKPAVRTENRDPWAE